MSKRFKNYIFIGLLAFMINVSLLYALPIWEYFRNFKTKKEITTSNIKLEKIITIKKEKKKVKKKIKKPKKLVQNKSKKTNDRFQMKFGSGMGGSGASLGVGKAIKGAVYREGEVDVEPKIIRQEPPIFPIEAQNTGVSGRVVLRIVISENGQVIQAVYESGTEEYGFKEAAIDAVMQWQFEPAIADGIPVKFEYLAPFSF